MWTHHTPCATSTSNSPDLFVYTFLLFKQKTLLLLFFFFFLNNKIKKEPLQDVEEGGRVSWYTDEKRRTCIALRVKEMGRGGLRVRL